mgnify:CR=1 FL=1
MKKILTRFVNAIDVVSRLGTNAFVTACLVTIVGRGKIHDARVCRAVLVVLDLRIRSGPAFAIKLKRKHGVSLFPGFLHATTGQAVVNGK